ncbi:MAG TPA: hypothetical protein VFX98_09180 [Longimicrobiaceae bacterium]|nr:hypothetical protein [Longimicrobiaceae bacterium]
MRTPTISRPPFRRLRGYAFDPSLSTQLETAVVNETVFRVRWEENLAPGPVGEYLEVVDFDPPSNCFYAPVDLNAPQVLAQDGLAPSEGNPQFHQQMVYAVAMTTIRNFERALGRWAMWAPFYEEGTRTRWEDQYVPRLRVYPHALREANAYYSPQKKALLFGYFPADPGDAGSHFPGGTVFTCLSHDIVAHETTHALLDGMHQRFMEPTHPDTLAFHEAFADIVALFQHFSFPEVLRHQIAKTRGDLASQSLLGELAQQFGTATGQYGALRSAIGEVDPVTKQWKPAEPDPADYRRVTEPHLRGAILVAAVFDGFLAIYRSRVADLLRIATAGTGVLPAGALHPDLVSRLAGEAAKAAQHVLNMCVRALDYCPPVDITFGDYLRALVTADWDIVRDDDKGYRVAVIEAFRRRGIFPRDVRTLSEDALRWQGPLERCKDFEVLADVLRGYLEKAQYFRTRKEAFLTTQRMQQEINRWINDEMQEPERFTQVTRIVVDPASPLAGLRRRTGGRPKVEVSSVRPARRIGPDGDFMNQVIVTLMQTRDVPDETALDWDGTGTGATYLFRGGAALILDLDRRELRYAIRKGIDSENRLRRQQKYRESRGVPLRAALLGGSHGEPFALLHRGF